MRCNQEKLFADMMDSSQEYTECHSWKDVRVVTLSGPENFPVVVDFAEWWTAGENSTSLKGKSAIKNFSLDFNLFTSVYL